MGVPLDRCSSAPRAQHGSGRAGDTLPPAATSTHSRRVAPGNHAYSDDVSPRGRYRRGRQRRLPGASDVGVPPPASRQALPGTSRQTLPLARWPPRGACVVASARPRRHRLADAPAPCHSHPLSEPSSPAARASLGPAVPAPPRQTPPAAQGPGQSMLPPTAASELGPVAQSHLIRLARRSACSARPAARRPTNAPARGRSQQQRLGDGRAERPASARRRRPGWAPRGRRQPPAWRTAPSPVLFGASGVASPEPLTPGRAIPTPA